MFKVLGSKRVWFIFGLSVVLGMAAYAYYDWLLPAHEKSTQELQASKSAVDQKYAEVVKMKEEYVLLQSQLRSYKELEAKGFFNDQDRSSGIDKLDRLSNYAGLLKANLKIGSGQIINDPSAQLANQIILKSPVKINVNSIDDVDVYSFIKFIQEKFPGRVDVTAISMERIEIFEMNILRKIGGGDTTPLVKASIDFDWLTMSPKDVAAPSEGNSIGISTGGGQ